MYFKNMNIEECCDLKQKEEGIMVQCNFPNSEILVNKLKENNNAKILFICSNDYPYTSFSQGFDLSETIKIRDYLNKLIGISRLAIN